MQVQNIWWCLGRVNGAVTLPVPVSRQLASGLQSGPLSSLLGAAGIRSATSSPWSLQVCMSALHSRQSSSLWFHGLQPAEQLYQQAHAVLQCTCFPSLLVQLLVIQCNMQSQHIVGLACTSQQMSFLRNVCYESVQLPARRHRQRAYAARTIGRLCAQSSLPVQATHRST